MNTCVDTCVGEQGIYIYLGTKVGQRKLNQRQLDCLYALYAQVQLPSIQFPRSPLTWMNENTHSHKAELFVKQPD